MRDRASIKQQAKQAFMGHYWPCVGAYVLIYLVISAAAGIGAGIGGLILGGPLAIGLGMFFLNLWRGSKPEVGDAFSVGFENFGRKLGGYLWMQLFIFLWSLLLIVPGIIKSFAYAMTPYILADCPNVKAQDALKISIRMMDGHKGELFVLYLSFIGWELLSALTFGILHIFYVGPYVSASLAGYYDEIKKRAIDSGVVAEAELA